MATNDLTKIYDGADLAGATSGVIYLPILRDSMLEGADVLTDAAQTGAAVFEVRKNGAVIAGLGALQIAGGARLGSVSGLSVALEKGDEIVLNLVSGNVSAPVTVNLVARDGETGGGGTGGAGILAAPKTANAFDDEFEGAALDANVWTKALTSGTIHAESFDDAIRSAYFVRMNANSELRLTRAFADAGDFSVTLCADFSPNANYNNLTLRVLNAAETSYVELQWLYNNGSFIRVNNNTDGALTFEVGGQAYAAAAARSVLFHVQRAGGTYTFSFSYDAVNWQTVGGVGGATNPMTMAKLRLILAASASVKSNFNLHWIRKNWLFL